MPKPIVCDYDPSWPQAFRALAAVLASALGELAKEIHHVGSTSIPGMPAKPVIDLDVELAPGAEVNDATEVLARLGYAFEGDRGIPERYAYRRTSPAVPITDATKDWIDHHLYVCPHGSVELARHLRFRDALRNSEALRNEYVALKREALRRARGDRAIYVEEKARLGDAFFRKVLEGRHGDAS